MLEVASLHVHPVKGCGAIDVEQLVLDVDGPRFDREWMLVGDDDVFVTQRQLPRMALVGVSVDAEMRCKWFDW